MSEKYWFVLKSSVFVWKEESLAFFYDSESFKGKRVTLGNPLIDYIVDGLMDINNLYTLSLNQSDVENKDVKAFIESLVELKVVKLVKESLVHRRPVQLPPLLNLQSEVQRLQKDNSANLFFSKNILENLQSITVNLGSEDVSSFVSRVFNFFDGLAKYRLLEVRIDEFRLDLDVSFWKRIEDLFISKKITLTLDDKTVERIEYIKKLCLSNLKLAIVVSPHTDLSSLKKIIVFEEDFSMQYLFNVYSENDYALADGLIEQCGLTNYVLEPLYNGENLSFFEEFVFISEEDILESCQTKQNIFAHQVLNSNDFGNLLITKDGNVYANLYQDSLGTIDDDLKALVYKEMIEGKSWRRVRDQQPCSSCIYQWLCPSPSNYELGIGRNNLCRVKE